MEKVISVLCKAYALSSDEKRYKGQLTLLVVLGVHDNDSALEFPNFKTIAISLSIRDVSSILTKKQ